MEMALSPITFRSFFWAICLFLAGLLAVSALAACSSEPETEPATSAPSTSADRLTIAPASQPAQEPALAATPKPANQAPEPTLAPNATPIVIIPSHTKEPQPTPIEGPASATEADQVTDSPASFPEGRSTPQIGPGATWGDVYESLSADEQSCALEQMGEERINEMWDLPFALKGLEEESVTLLDCVSDDTARDLFLADTAAQMGGLTQEQEGCLRTLLSGFSPSELAAASAGEPTPEGAMLMLSFGLGLVGCLPELAAQPPGGLPTDAGVDGSGQLVQDPSLIWSFTTGGWVLIAPAVVDGVVYAGSDDQSLYALKAETGELIWSHATGDVIRSTPTVVDGRVFFGSNDNHVYALEAATGQELWKHDTGDWVQYSPAVHGGTVYIAGNFEGNRKVHALDAATGEVIWVADHPFPIGAEHTPSPIGDTVYAQGAEYGQFFALDATTGETAWQADLGGYVESAPVSLDGVVYLTVANRAYALNEMTGEPIWELNTEEFPARDFPALIVDGLYYLTPSSQMYALDVATGEEIWGYESGMLSTAPIIVDGVLYGASGEGGTIFALDSKTGEPLWTEATGDDTVNALTAVEGILYGELSNGQLIAANSDSGIPLWSFEKGGFSDLRGYTVADGVVYSAGPNNSVYAHRAPEG